MTISPTDALATSVLTSVGVSSGATDEDRTTKGSSSRGHGVVRQRYTKSTGAAAAKSMSAQDSKRHLNGDESILILLIVMLAGLFLVIAYCSAAETYATKLASLGLV